jgi:uncharacterized protein (DUF1778 family)
MAARKRNPGRPKKNDTRGKLLQIRLTESERSAMTEAANKAGVSVSDYVRLAVRAAIAQRKLDLPGSE